jgi:uncharacterized cupredoxin-like copper-binding protein
MKRVAAVVALSSAVVVGACSPKEAARDTTKVAQTGAPSNNGGSYDPATHTVHVKATDFAFGAPDTIPAGWTTFHMMNDGAMFHHVTIVRVDSGKTMADVEAALKTQGPPPKWLVELGGPNAPDPTNASNATLNLQPGLYALLCFVDLPDKIPHFAKGMVRPLTVVAGTSNAAEPTADLTITLADYSFTTAGAVKSGHHTVKVLNSGPQMHEVELMRLAPGKTMKDFGAWIAKMDGPPPGSGIGGIAGTAPGTTGYFDVDLSPGNYAFICFIPDAKDGKPHLEHGMVKEFKVE